MLERGAGVPEKREKEATEGTAEVGGEIATFLLWEGCEEPRSK